MKLTAIEKEVLEGMHQLNRGEGSISAHWLLGDQKRNTAAARRLVKKGYLKATYFGSTRYFLTEKAFEEK